MEFRFGVPSRSSSSWMESYRRGLTQKDTDRGRPQGRLHFWACLAKNATHTIPQNHRFPSVASDVDDPSVFTIPRRSTRFTDRDSRRETNVGNRNYQRLSSRRKRERPARRLSRVIISQATCQRHSLWRSILIARSSWYTVGCSRSQVLRESHIRAFNILYAHDGKSKWLCKIAMKAGVHRRRRFWTGSLVVSLWRRLFLFVGSFRA